MARELSNHRLQNSRSVVDVHSSTRKCSILLRLRRSDGKALETLRSICSDSEKAIATNAFENLTDLDIRFHETITSSSRSEQLWKILNNIRERSWYIRRWLFGIHHHEQDEYSAVAEHKAILSKMIDGDIEALDFACESI
jgi:DNA-binding GntR family transcriptional regulator